MPAYFAGQELDELHFAAAEIKEAHFAGDELFTSVIAPPVGPVNQPGTLSVVGERRPNSRVREFTATLADANGVTAINSVTWAITRNDAARTVRFSHTLFEVRTVLPATRVEIVDLDLPNNFRAGARNYLVVTANYTDPTGTYTLTGEAVFTTVQNRG